MEHRPYIWIDEPDADAHVRYYRSRRQNRRTETKYTAADRNEILTPDQMNDVKAAQMRIEEYLATQAKPDQGFVQAIFHGAAGALRL